MMITETHGDETFVDLAEVAAHLHRDESEVVLLVDPGEEGLVFVVEDTTPSIPTTVATGIAQNTETKYRH